MKDKINLNLNYHDFSGTKERFTDSIYTVDFNEFKKQLDLIGELKVFKIIDLLKIVNSDFCISFTFDDGYRSNMYIAEELAKRNIVGTFFIIKDKCLNDFDYINKEELKELAKMGMEIGSHSCSHRHMNRLSNAELYRELHESKIFLEDILGKQINTIAFPGGQCGRREFDASLKEGYLLNRTTISGINHLPVRNNIIKSITIKKNININVFKQIIELSTDFYLKTKVRELLLSFPKYLESKYKTLK